MMRAIALALALALSACTTPRVVERVRTVEVVKPVAAPCPDPADVRPMPAKPATLPPRADAALATVTRYLADLLPWAETAERQIRACSQMSSNP